MIVNLRTREFTVGRATFRLRKVRWALTQEVQDIDCTVLFRDRKVIGDVHSAEKLEALRSANWRV